MNLRLRLIISHVVMFFMPILTILIIGTIFLASAMFLVRGQNHLHLETMSKCSYAAEITSHILLHGDVSSPKNDPAEWLISILSPQQNLIVLTRKSTPVYIWKPGLPSGGSDLPSRQPMAESGKPQHGAVHPYIEQHVLLCKKIHPPRNPLLLLLHRSQRNQGIQPGR